MVMPVFRTIFINSDITFFIRFFIGMAVVRMAAAAAHPAVSPVHEKHQQGKQDDID